MDIQNYNIVFVTDNNYLQYMFVTCQSIIDALEDLDSNDNDQLIFHVLTDNSVNQESALALSSKFQNINAQSKVKFAIEFHEVDPSLFATYDDMIRLGQTSKATYYKLLFSHFVRDDVRRVLLLDIDTVVRADIRKIFHDHPMYEEVMYASQHPLTIEQSKNLRDPNLIVEFTPRNSSGQPYEVAVRDMFNAGVMLINVEQWKKQNIEQKCFEVGLHCVLPYYDESMLNIVCKRQVSFLRWDWHALVGFSIVATSGMFYVQKHDKIIPFSKLCLHGNPSQEEFRALVKHTKIVHFSPKPWEDLSQLSAGFMYSIQDMLPAYAQWVKIFKRLKSQLFA